MRTLLIVFLSTLFISSSFTQNKFDIDFTIQSKAFNKERKFYVHVPERYYEDEKTEFGVIYMLDGQGREFLNNAKSIIDYLVWSSQVTPYIVVGIHTDNRGSEFVPKDRTLTDDDPDNNGEAHLLQAHIENEIFPIIADSFRVTKFKALVGHSRGGAFVANTLFSVKKDMFDAYIAISPGMHYINRQILNDAETMIQSKTDFHKFYTCTHGTVGALEKYFEPQVEFIDSLLKAHPNPTLEWSKQVFEGTTHWTQVAPALTQSLLKMSRAYQPDQFLIEQYAENNGLSIASQVSAYYKQQEKKLGFTIPMDAGSYRYYGNQQSEIENHVRAIELFDLAIELELGDIRSHTGKAQSYRELNDKANAIKSYKAALNLLDAGEHTWNADRVERTKKYILEELVKLK